LNQHRHPPSAATGALILALILTAGLASKALAAAITIKPDTAELNEIVVNGIPYKETVLPTRLSSSSVYGLDLNVMDTPRNTTLLSTTQLATLNIQDPRAFSYLTASSYTDSSFGTPNIPRIRGQYADVFYNGMRSSFTENGYGVPLNFDSFENISITKGPASVVDGPGPGVGGQADFITKRPSLTRMTYAGSASIDTVQNRRFTLDIGGPVIPGELGVRLSYSGEDSDSYFYGHYFRKNAIYGAVRWEPNSNYRLDFNTELISEQYSENGGINRVNQALIDRGTYLPGGPNGLELFSSLIGSPPIAIGPGTPAVPILTGVVLGGSVPFDTRVTIDQTPGTSSRGLKYNAQLIQAYRLNNSVTLEDNAFFDYQDSDNAESYYYADSSNGSWTFENRVDVKLKYDWNIAGLTIKNEVIVGGTFRFAHVNYISNFNIEVPMVFDLSNKNPLSWNVGTAYQGFADAYPYTSSLGKSLYGVPGRDSTSGGNGGISDLYDTAFFIQHRVEFSPQFSALYGGRIDVVQAHTHDQLGGASCCFNNLPRDRATGTYGLGNGNISLVYRPRPWVSGYVTFDFTQSVNPNGGEGGVNAYGQVPDSHLLRADSYLYEAGLKFNLLSNKLFAGLAGFDQKRGLPAGPGGTQTTQANIRGVEVEMNYQPTRNLFATASYSYIRTTLNKPAGFYNYPAEVGLNIDGAGLATVFTDGQKFNDPGVPQQIFNFLGNYKFNNGFGFRMGVQVTGPIDMTTSGQIDIAGSNTFFGQTLYDANGNAVPLAPLSLRNKAVNGLVYYQSPRIPWQYTMNMSIFYETGPYIYTDSAYNITDRLNWQSSPAFYGSDFLVRNDPRTIEFRLQARF
jgi:outer membrane receptor protein involved in Fe transport